MMLGGCWVWESCKVPGDRKKAWAVPLYKGMGEKSVCSIIGAYSKSTKAARKVYGRVLIKKESVHGKTVDGCAV